MFDNGASNRSATWRRLYDTPSIWISAFEPIPKLSPRRGPRSTLPLSPDTVKVSFQA